ncbi:MAG: OmpH family outer membrane protein [Pseudomonadota bacterium]
MKLMTKMLAGVGLAAAVAAAPLSAQVQGKLATASISRAVQNTSALQTAFNQVNQTYSAQIQTAQQKQTELSELLKPFDANGNGEIDGAENNALEGAPNFATIQTLQREIGSINEQVTAAQVYAVEQILIQYPAALEEIAGQQQITMVVDPASLQFAAEGADITDQVTTSLNTKAPTVGIVPPNGWRPSPNSVQVFQDIQRRLILRRLREQQAQQQQQQEQGNGEAPAGR